jgi:hypothetical protein
MRSRQLPVGIWQSRYAGASRNIDLFNCNHMLTLVVKVKHSDDKAYHLTMHFF